MNENLTNKLKVLKSEGKKKKKTNCKLEILSHKHSLINEILSLLNYNSFWNELLKFKDFLFRKNRKKKNYSIIKLIEIENDLM